MSILTATSDDVGGKGGRPLPNAKWASIIEEAQANMPDGNGTRFFARLGQITTPEGSSEYTNGDASAPYRIGNRKVFVREWTDHTSQQAVEIGERRIKQLLMATGIIPKPEKGKAVDLAALFGTTTESETYEKIAQAVVGRRVVFTSKQRPRLTKQQNEQGVEVLVPKLDAEGMAIVDVEVAAFHTA